MVLSLQLAHRLEDKNVLLIGAGEVALTRLFKLVPTGCKVTLIAPEINAGIVDKFCPYIRDLDIDYDVEEEIIDPEWDLFKGKHAFKVIKSEFKESHLSMYKIDQDSGIAFIMTCIPNPELSEFIYHKSKELFGSQQMVNVADNPPLCDFYFGANLNLGSSIESNSTLQLLISSNGSSPRFTALIKNEIEKLLKDIDIESSVKKLGQLRTAIRNKSNTQQDLKYRMEWIKNMTDIFGTQHCHQININRVVDLYDTMYKNNKSLEFPSNKEMIELYTSPSS
ncbi:hypothetical protein Kpol_530p45 [Vanderwaltozyma polyspora DSM 70294]|uniref:precorrin-2 dehydrogenase n=1 Tax=Vanderwaltozyma polyspora (strain ATCC 22028 / DSM 70294 / BCRC 21397 / CBS 2163 / NBRC 10782 / NRRL Y-8283 / UCD 57-17) TaxID=436907 RepID=A7TL19_VANPO|nr:uncharacterized protein Kpol_530p45 [Vanderwaltozyma polyspora DSM 70294]EDO17075.1 hypothetical protein Kpol_530p45 [Vanderwaltozyma polyspora DSM 70294]